ncbi:sulfite exporter TauE/SafE family protein [Sandaracinobacteroides hominis]|uniref:sulfite exporter TauE/SafE family protein n=1 Tax=Sandaracinobacteroides hominis TaxID=2780086 RepID=UPI0018F5C45E|nr:sulfite exporter TauE/SafE family protein [Sandaracinobacteroides hominis]
MEFDSFLLLFVLVGFVAQLIDSSLGGGFGVISSSVLIATGVPPAAASAGIHAVKVVTAPISGLSHALAGNVDWRLFWKLALPGVLGAIAGAWLLTGLPVEMAKLLIQIYLGTLGAVLLLRQPMRHGHHGEPKVVGPLGFAAGALDSAGGGGWGPIVTPNLILQGAWPRKAVGTTNMAEFLVALASSVTFISVLGWESLGKAVLGLLAGAVVAAPLGALLAKRLKGAHLVRLVGGLLLVTSLAGLGSRFF